MARYAASRVFRLELVAIEQTGRDLGAQDDVIESSLLELQQPSDVFVDDADLDHAGPRERYPSHAAHEGRVRRIVALRKANLPVTRIRLQHDARAALPFAKAIRARSHWPCADVASGGFDDFAGGGADEADQVLDVGVIRLGKTYLHGIAVERAQALDRPVVVELRGGARGVDDRAGAYDGIGDDRRSAAAEIRVQPALVRIDVIRGDELARLAFERRVVGEKDARFHAHRPRFAAVGNR